MWLFTACVGAASAADCPSPAAAGCRGWALLHLPPAPVLEVSIFLPSHRPITSAVNTTANVTAAEGRIRDLGSTSNS